MATEMIIVLVRLRRKIENHRRGQQRSVQGLLDQIVDRLADIDRLVEGNAELHAGRNADHLRQGLPQGIHHFHGIGDRLLVDPKIDGSGPSVLTMLV